jgi:hypothetical protein
MTPYLVASYDTQGDAEKFSYSNPDPHGCVYVYKSCTVSILMHQIQCDQMPISTTYVSSVMLGPKNLEIRNNARHTKQENTHTRKRRSHEMEPNPSKDRAMLEGDDPSFEMHKGSSETTVSIGPRYIYS